MALLKKQNGSGTESKKSEMVYKSSDNLGTFYSDYNKANSAWLAQGMLVSEGTRAIFIRPNSPNKEIISKGSPYIAYTFKTEEAARKGLSSISYIKIACDTNAFISLETLEFGCFKDEFKGYWEVIIWGGDFTLSMFEESKTKLSEAGGNKKGERIPSEKVQITHNEINPPGKTTFFRTVFEGPNTYDIYKAPSKVIALEFLKTKTVMKPLYYIVVETPEGNWGKDIDGIYQE